MKLVIFGLTISSSWGNGHATLWRGLCRALAANGHRVTFFERDVPYYAAHRDLQELGDGRLILYSCWEDAEHGARAELSDADVAITTSYCPDALAAAQFVMESDALRVFYDLDTPVTLSRLDRGELVPYIAAAGLSEYDLVLSYTGGEALAHLQQRLGARRVAALYGSVDPVEHHPAARREEFRSHLSYLGTYAADRQHSLKRLFIEPARQHPDFRFLIAGAQYPQTFPWAENIFFARHLAPSEHPAFYSSSRLTLNITRGSMAAMGYCPSGRLFEAAACGTPILSDSWAGLDEFFTPRSEILLAETSDDVTDALSRSDSELFALGQAARERALSEHTAAHRARELEALLSDALCTPAST